MRERVFYILQPKRKFKPTPTTEELRAIFTYSIKTGEILWKQRPRNHFKSQQAFSCWNNKYSVKPAGTRVTRSNGKIHEEVRINGIRYISSRIVMALNGRDLPDGMEVDHMDKNPSNNRIENLRLATSAQNKHNRKTTKTNGLPKGVIKHGRKFWASIMANGKMRYFPGRKTVEESSEDYRQAAQELHGDFACLE